MRIATSKGRFEVSKQRIDAFRWLKLKRPSGCVVVIPSIPDPKLRRQVYRHIVGRSEGRPVLFLACQEPGKTVQAHLKLQHELQLPLREHEQRDEKWRRQPQQKKKKKKKKRGAGPAVTSPPEHEQPGYTIGVPPQKPEGAGSFTHIDGLAPNHDDHERSYPSGRYGPAVPDKDHNIPGESLSTCK